MILYYLEYVCNIYNIEFVITIERLPWKFCTRKFFFEKKGSASIWVVIPVPFHATIEEFCSQDIGICPVEHAPLNCFGFIDSPLQ